MPASIRILRFINYGNVMSGTEIDSDTIIHKFYWSFLELSNGRIVNIMTTCYSMPEGGFSDCDLQILPTSCYSFGDNFDKWWEKSFTHDAQEKSLKDLTIEEYLLVKEFYFKNIFDARETVTEVIRCE